jgi:hypothetical protein
MRNTANAAWASLVAVSVSLRLQLLLLGLLIISPGGSAI